MQMTLGFSRHAMTGFDSASHIGLKMFVCSALFS
jgi:hypothetical protein